jgi:hypothetical protein
MEDQTEERKGKGKGERDAKDERWTRQRLWKRLLQGLAATRATMYLKSMSALLTMSCQ